MASSKLRPPLASLFLFCAAASPVFGQTVTQTGKTPGSAQKTASPPASKQPAAIKQPTPEEELQLAVSTAGNDRAMLVRNLEAFLGKHPENENLSQIYRALVEASLQLRDDARASDYAERIVALNPNDIPITMLTIQLLERKDDEAALRRAVSYAARVIDFVNRTSPSDRSPRVSEEQWQREKKADQASALFIRGNLYMKLKDYRSAQQDFETSYQITPAAGAAERLGETAELRKDWDSAITEYSRAFALAEGKNGNVSRKEIRQKLGNVWRMAHGSDEGLGAYMLRTFDDVSQIPGSVKHEKNADAREPSEFTLRKAPEGTPFPLQKSKGRILVLDFWTTWCGPCRALDPLFGQVATQFNGVTDVTFLAANCDEDETLVAGYLAEAKPHTAVVFADGLDRLLAVNSFPTVVVINREGKIAYRANGFSPDTFEQELAAAVRRILEAQNKNP
jgi:thiol-disulfide isomerase/thioredoxin/regulator of sirC expression with transglutaminase-like and TPR domain